MNIQLNLKINLHCSSAQSSDLFYTQVALIHTPSLWESGFSVRCVKYIYYYSDHYILKQFSRVHFLNAKKMCINDLNTMSHCTSYLFLIVYIFYWHLAIKIYWFTLYCVVLYCIVLYCVALRCIALHCIVLHRIALYCIVLYWKTRNIVRHFFFWFQRKGQWQN